MSEKQLGAVLTQHGAPSAKGLDSVVAEQQGKALQLGEMFIESEVISKPDIGAALEEVNGAGYVEGLPSAIAPEVLALVLPSVAFRCCALPLSLQGKKLIVAMGEPQNLAYLDELRFSAEMEISPRFALRSDVLAGIKKFYGDKESCLPTEEEEPEEDKAWLIHEVDVSGMEFLTNSAREDSREAQEELVAGWRQRTPAVRFVSTILAIAASKKASDIHIEPGINGACVRLRVDGLLQKLTIIPVNQQAAVISRIKILADMDIAERRVPQDGRLLMQFHGTRLDLRVSTLPTHFGEKVVLRLLDLQATCVSFEQLGLSKENADALTQILSLPQGTLIVTGPTGSGKSTTLSAGLNFLRSPTRNIITVEDPIEYMVEGISQVQVNPKAGLYFANSLRSILRQDPDVIMVGEIRDGETAEIALQASQTGHIVLSSLHTNDSIAAVTRLRDLKVPAYLVAASISGVLSQRLVRTLCDCRKEVPVTPEYMDRLVRLGVEQMGSTTYQPVGCPDCDNNGYKGRVGIYEMLVIDDLIREAIYLSVSPEEIRSLAHQGSFKSLQQDALAKVREGRTTLDEVLRVVPFKANQAARHMSHGVPASKIN